jgi:cell wall-associated NlpC family hydrolase
MPRHLDLNIETDTTPDPVTGQAVKQPLPDQGSLGSALVAAAKNFLGIPYSWGGGTDTGPSKGFGRGANTVGFDCSSLMKNVFAQFGIHIPRVTYDQFKALPAVPNNAMQPGDLLFFHPGANGPGHVGLYIGNGQFLHAPSTGDVVKVSALSSRGDLVGVRRPR